jgi:chemotaxis protein methyltransferase CheR
MVLDAEIAAMSQRNFETLRALFEQETGIHLDNGKKLLVVTRLHARLEALALDSFDDYCALLQLSRSSAERSYMVDALTTHETYFFREAQQFVHLGEITLPALRGRLPRVWSAAASSGEEAYSLAMVLTDKLGPSGSEIYGSDISIPTLETAKRGLYPAKRLDNIPKTYLERFFLKGLGHYTGKILVSAEIRSKPKFVKHNLMSKNFNHGLFDVIFLRNVLIYFNPERRRIILSNVISNLSPGGYLYLGQAESQDGGLDALKPLGQSVFRRIK